jgi:hypothetical protein
MYKKIKRGNERGKRMSLATMFKKAHADAHKEEYKQKHKA